MPADAGRTGSMGQISPHMAKTGCPELSGAWSATRIFCLPDGRDLVHTIDEAEDLVLSAASVQLDVSGGR